MDTDKMPRMSPSAIASTVSTAVTKPIPALYTVYVLRSTIRHASLYIGSTPDPPRRLKQHNGEIKGGAARTSRPRLRPWEMIALVSGFPGSVAALKFEWALTNPHLSLHIPAESRLSQSRVRKRNGRPRRPLASMQSIVANLHLLLGVPSFTRWPLRLHMLAPEVLVAWDKWLATSGQTKPPTLELVTDFAAPASPDTKTGVYAFSTDYTPLRDYVDKARDIFTFERAHDCAVCHDALPSGHGGLAAVCPNTACEAVGHLRCWSAHLLAKEAVPSSGTEDEAHEHPTEAPLVPVRGHCPACGGPVVWADMMKELTLRLRAPKEVDKLIKAKRKQEKAKQKQEKAKRKQEKADAAATASDDSVVELDSDRSQSPVKSPRRKAVKATAVKRKVKTAVKTADASAEASSDDSVIEIDSDRSQSPAKSPRRKASKATAGKSTVKSAAKTATETAVKTTKATAKKTPKPRAKAADTTPKITKTARVTKRKDTAAKKPDSVVIV